jgi:hypothetical protein
VLAEVVLTQVALSGAASMLVILSLPSLRPIRCNPMSAVTDGRVLKGAQPGSSCCSNLTEHELTGD